MHAVYLNSAPSPLRSASAMIGKRLDSVSLSGWTQTYNGYQHAQYVDRSGNTLELFMAPGDVVDVVVYNGTMLGNGGPL